MICVLRNGKERNVFQQTENRNKKTTKTKQKQTPPQTKENKNHRNKQKCVSENVSFSDDGPLLETLEFFEISHGSYQPLNFLLYLKLPTSILFLYQIQLFEFDMKNFSLKFNCSLCLDLTFIIIIMFKCLFGIMRSLRSLSAYLGS